MDGRRTLQLRSLLLPLENPMPEPPFVAMLPAFGVEERRRSSTLLGRLVDQGCVELCCVGPDAEALHDELDSEIEARSALNVVTTWHEELEDACDYFVIAAGGQAARLIAFVSEHPQLEQELAARFRSRP